MTELSDKIQQYIEVDDSGRDLDQIEIIGETGKVGLVLMSSRTLHLAVKSGTVTLPDGTKFTLDDMQLAFQNALIAKTGRCVLEEEYHRAGFPELARMALGARSED